MAVECFGTSEPSSLFEEKGVSCSGLKLQVIHCLLTGHERISLLLEAPGHIERKILHQACAYALLDDVKFFNFSFMTLGYKVLVT